MQKFRSSLQHFEFHLLLLIAGLIVLTRPRLLMSNTETPGTVLFSFYVPWAIIIFILVLVSMSYATPTSEEDDDSSTKED